MPFDAPVMTAVVEELKGKIGGARIQRIYQPERFEVVFHLHRPGLEQKLLLSCHPGTARVHLTGRSFRNPEQPAPFCMLLRKYLVGGSVEKLFQPEGERVLEIAFNPPEGLPPVKLMAEIMGRRSNLVLVDAKNIILGAVRTASGEQNRYRAVQAGAPYRPVPPQDKINPYSAGQAEFYEKFSASFDKDGERNPAAALVATVKGVSPLAARELVHRAGPPCDNRQRYAGRLFEELKRLFTAGSRQPVMVRQKDLYAAFPLTHLPDREQEHFDSINDMLDRFYTGLIDRENTDRLREMLRGRVTGRLASLERKEAGQKEELRQSGEAFQYRIYGELLLAYAGQVPRGATQAELPDFHQPGHTVTVPLDPALSAGANAQKYFSRYRRARKGKAKIDKQLALTGEEIRYCRGLLFDIDNGDNRSLEEIREELVEAGLLKQRQRRAPKKKVKELPQPLSLQSSAGHRILVGQNNRQNDYLTFSVASRRDTWLHAHDLPGSHVLIRDVPFPPPAATLEEAALLAAHFSRGREQPAVAVDYTEARHVRRKPGGKPGAALYDNFETISVNPRDSRLQELLPATVK